MMLNIIFLGLPGSGKGTQAQLISQKFKLDLISVGDLLRSECEKASDIGNQIKSIIDNGKLVTLDIIESVLLSNIKLNKSGVIFDGIPRNIEQAKLLDKVMLDLGRKIDFVIEFNIDESVIIERLKKRYICNVCHAILCLSDHAIKHCTYCNASNISKRDDDVCDKAVCNRIDTYNIELGDIKEFYAKKGILHKIDANQLAENVTNNIEKLIKNKKD